MVAFGLPIALLFDLFGFAFRYKLLPSLFTLDTSFVFLSETGDFLLIRLIEPSLFLFFLLFSIKFQPFVDFMLNSGFWLFIWFAASSGIHQNIEELVRLVLAEDGFRWIVGSQARDLRLLELHGMD